MEQELRVWSSEASVLFFPRLRSNLRQERMTSRTRRCAIPFVFVALLHRLFAATEGFRCDVATSRRTTPTYTAVGTAAVFATAANDDHMRRFTAASKPSQSQIHDTISSFLEQLHPDTLQSFTLRGPSKKLAAAAATITSTEVDASAELRGVLRMVVGRKIQLGRRDKVEEKMQVTFKYHGATDICKNWELRECKSHLASILLAAQQHNDGGAVVPKSEWGEVVLHPPGSKYGMKSASLQMINHAEVEMNIGGKGKAKLIYHTNKRKLSAQAVPDRLQLSHDRAKREPVDRTDPLWQALGVTADKSGRLKAGMSSKFRQCTKFVEIVDRLIGSSIQCHGDDGPSSVSVVDMGCGRGYLTFALHGFLTQKYGNVSSRGIDVRPKLVHEVSIIAASLGDKYRTLHFETGTIESFLAEQSEISIVERDEMTASTKILIALHACDTATDDALWSGIARKSDIIVVAPCCQRQIRVQLDKHHANVKDDHVYSDILRHGIYRERMAETVTDSLRALLLELAGYTVQVFEFIGGEHTSKNVMITAVRLRTNNSKSAKNDDTILERIHHLAKLHGIREQKLAGWMKISLLDYQTNGEQSSKLRPITAKSMPPFQT
jgi:Methyltransferase domain